MDLALEGVHVLVTGMVVSSLQTPLNIIVYSGASGGHHKLCYNQSCMTDKAKSL